MGWSYKGRFPESTEREKQHGFLYIRGVPQSIRWIGGFGEIGWISGQKFSDTVPDPLAYIGMDIITHMNEDHADSMLVYLKLFTEIDTDGVSALMTNIYESGFTLQVKNSSSITSTRKTN